MSDQAEGKSDTSSGGKDVKADGQVSSKKKEKKEKKAREAQNPNPSKSQGDHAERPQGDKAKPKLSKAERREIQVILLCSLDGFDGVWIVCLVISISVYTWFGWI